MADIGGRKVTFDALKADHEHRSWHCRGRCGGHDFGNAIKIGKCLLWFEFGELFSEYSVLRGTCK